MKRIVSLFVLFSLLFNMGCASYHPAVLSAPDRGQYQIKIDDEIRVKLHNGESVKGKVIRIDSDDFVIIGVSREFVLEDRVITASEIKSIEVHKSSSGNYLIGATRVSSRGEDRGTHPARPLWVSL